MHQRAGLAYQRFSRCYGRLYLDHVTQAPKGCDFDFLEGGDPVEVTEQPKF